MHDETEVWSWGDPGVFGTLGIRAPATALEAEPEFESQAGRLSPDGRFLLGVTTRHQSGFLNTGQPRILHAPRDRGRQEFWPSSPGPTEAPLSSSSKALSPAHCTHATLSERVLQDLVRSPGRSSSPPHRLGRPFCPPNDPSDSSQADAIAVAFQGHLSRFTDMAVEASAASATGSSLPYGGSRSRRPAPGSSDGRRRIGRREADSRRSREPR